jgi:predicted metal-dependent HD superfamily phosphohydrolase
MTIRFDADARRTVPLPCVWSDLSCERFAALVERLGGDPSRAADVFSRLQAAWAAADRHYHNLEHLADCLRELDGAGVAGESADVAELALWYHDAVYDPRARDCEERSAALLVEDGAALALPEAITREAARCVRATRDHEATIAPAELVCDADLSILGRDPMRFMEYEHAVREEYAHVPSVVYFVARGRFLAALLAKPTIFRTAHFQERYQACARANLTGLLASPRYRSYRWLGWLHRWR